MSHLGDYIPGVTIYSYFTTIDADGVPTTLSGSPTATCYKDGGNTQDNSGVTLTADEDGVTGLNVVAIDTSQDGTFFAAGSTFVIVLDAGTVDGTSVVGYTIDTFTLSRSAAFARLGAPAGASTAADIAAIKAETATIVADTNEVQISLAAGGLIESMVDDLQTEVDGIQADTEDIQSRLPAALTGGGNIKADVLAISGDTGAADTLETWLDDTAGAVPWLGIIDQGTAQSATATTLVLRAATPFGSDDAILGATLWAFGSTQGYWQSRLVTDYTTADDTATVAAWDVTPSGTITYKIFGTAPQAAGSGSGATAQEVWEYATRELTALDEDNTTIDINAAVTAAVPTAVQIRTEIDSNSTQLAAIVADTNEVQISLAAGGLIESMVDDLQTEVDGIQADTEDIQSRLPAALVNSRMDCTIDGTGMEQGALARFFSGDSGTTYASAVAGSVVKETADNAGGSALTADAIADEVETRTIAAVTVVNGLAANVITAAATAADFTTEIQNGLATAASLATLDGKVDTIDNLLDTEMPALTTAVADLPTNAELATALGTADDAVLAAVATVDTVVDAIKAKTDSLTFTVANVLDANIQRVNDVAVGGTGALGDEWGPV